MHRDIATKNIFLANTTDMSKVMLGDLGLSKDTQPGDSKGHSAGVASTLCGTPKYFSPELLSDSMYGQPADVWALGVVVFEMLTLRAPFVAQNMMQLIFVEMASNHTTEA